MSQTNQDSHIQIQMESDATTQCSSSSSRLAGKSLKEIHAEHAVLNARIQGGELNETELVAEIVRLQRDVVYLKQTTDDIVEQSSEAKAIVVKEATKRLGTLKYLTTTTTTTTATTNFSPLQDMSRDFFALQASVWLERKELACLDSAMCSREGRVCLLKALRSGVVIYEGIRRGDLRRQQGDE